MLTCLFNLYPARKLYDFTIAYFVTSLHYLNYCMICCTKREWSRFGGNGPCYGAIDIGH